MKFAHSPFQSTWNFHCVSRTISNWSTGWMIRSASRQMWDLEQLHLMKWAPSLLHVWNAAACIMLEVSPSDCVGQVFQEFLWLSVGCHKKFKIAMLMCKTRIHLYPLYISETMSLVRSSSSVTTNLHTAVTWWSHKLAFVPVTELSFLLAPPFGTSIIK